jgi:hypothetical protein
MLAALVVIVCVVTVGGSARVERGLAEPIWTGQVSLAGFTLGGRSLYFAESNGRAVVARDLWTGAVRWRRPVSELPLSTMDIGGGVAAVLTRTSLAPEFGPSWTVTFVADDTGAALTAPVSKLIMPPAVTIDGRLVVLKTRAACPDATSPGTDECTDVRGIDPRTGAEAWRMSLPANTYSIDSYVDGRIEAFGYALDEDTVEIRSPRTGAVERRISGPSLSNGYTMLSVDTLVSVTRDADLAVVTAYRRDGTRWSAPVPVPKQNVLDNGPFFYLVDCGPVLCLYVGGADLAAGGEVLLDRVTGRQRAKVRYEVFGAVNDRFLLAGPLLDPSDSNRPPEVVSILDASDGRVIATLEATAMVGWDDGGGRALLAQRGADRTAFVVVDREGNRHPIGSVPGVNLTCAARAEALACSEPRGRVRVWRIPSPRSA